MIPWLQKRKDSTGVIVQQRKSDGSLVDAYNDEGDAPNEMEACARDILSAIASKDVKLLAIAIQSAIELCQMGPEQESE